MDQQTSVNVIENDNADMTDMELKEKEQFKESTGKPPDKLINLCKLAIQECPSEDSNDYNNNSKVFGKEATATRSLTTEVPLFRTTSVPILERQTHLTPSSPRMNKKKKKVGEKKDCKKKLIYALEPIPRGIFGEVLQKKPNGKPKYTDIATVIYQGTSEHRNVDTTAASRYSDPATLDDSYASKLFYAKQLMPGAISLEELMKQKKGRILFSEAQAKFVCASLLQALKFLHENDIVHGSIMPKNIVFNDKCYPLLCNFNTAEILTERVARFRKRLPLEYTAPEQCFEDLSEVTDIFQLGVVIYEMIFGRVPHQGDSDFETRRNLCNSSIVPIFDGSKLSSQGLKFLSLCLKKSERKRFNIMELRKRLFPSIPWFDDLDEDKIFDQTFPSPLKAKITNLRKEHKREDTDRKTDMKTDQKSPVSSLNKASG